MKRAKVRAAPENGITRKRADAFESERRKRLASHAMRLKVLTIEGEDTTGRSGGASRKIEYDDTPLGTYLSAGKLLWRPLDVGFLSDLGEYSGTLAECVQAYEVNIDGFGHKLAPIDPKHIDEPDCRAEFARLTNFFRYAFLDGSFVDFRRRLRRDLEFTGNAYIEVIRHPDTGLIDGFEHIPARDVWIGVLSKTRYSVKQKRLMMQPDGSYKLDTIACQRRFRTYFQSKDGGVTGVWFKDFGDPRFIDLESGDEAKTLDESMRANELIHLRLFTPRTPYGVPRYISQVLTIFGERAADEINYTTLKNNNIPSMMLLVSNGLLTEGTINRLQDFSNEQRAGKKDYSRFLLVEAEGDIEGEHTNVKLDVKPLKDIQQQDELFKEYSKSNQRKLRAIFRLPELFVGAGEDFNKSTATVARKLAEEQVFAPEREEFDRFINRSILPELDARFFVFKSNTPNVTDDEDLIKVLQVAEKTGALTPRLARMIIEDIMNASLGEFKSGDKFDPDLPFTLAMAEAVKNKAAMSVPTQVAPDTVEAVKSIFGINGMGATVEGLLEVRRAFEHALTPSTFESDLGS